MKLNATFLSSNKVSNYIAEVLAVKIYNKKNNQHAEFA